MSKRRSSRFKRSRFPPDGRRWRRRCLLAAVIVILAIAGWFAFRWLTFPKAVTPTNLAGLEPAVRSLIEPLIEHTNQHRGDAAAHGDLGLAYEANRMWKEARQSFDNAVLIDPDSKLWRLHLAIALQETGDFPQATEILTELARIDREFAAVQHRLGRILLTTGDVDGAAAAFDRVISLVPHIADGHVGRAEVCLQRNEVDRAIQLLETAVKHDKTYGVAHHLLGRAYQAKGMTDAAQAEFRLGQRAELRYLADPLSVRVEKYAVSSKARNNRAARLLTTRQFPAAVKTLETLLASEPNNTTALNNLAIAYVQLGKSSEAFQLLQKARRLEDRKFTTYVNLTTWAISQQRWNEALEFGKAAVERAPWVADPYIVQAQVLRQLKRPQEAKELLLRAQEKVPQDPRIQRLLSEL